MRRLVEHAWILTMDEAMQEFRHGQMVIDDDCIAYVGEQVKQEHMDEIIDVNDAIVLPGMIHLDAPLHVICDRLLKSNQDVSWMELESLAYLSSKYAIGELLTSGVTTFVDVASCINHVAMACEELGIRALLQEHSKEQDQSGRMAWKDMLSTWRQSRLITGTIALELTRNTKASVLERAMKIAKEEDTMLVLDCLTSIHEDASFGEPQPILNWLDELHCLNEHVLLRNISVTKEADLSLLKRRGCSVVAQPKIGKHGESQGSLLQALCAYRIPTGFGMGVFHQGGLELFSSLRHCAMSQQEDRFPMLSARELVKIATIEAAKALHLEHAIGSLEVGKKADLIVVDATSFAMYPVSDPFDALVYRATSHDVTTVIVDGQPVVKQCQPLYARKELKEALDVELQEWLRHKEGMIV